MKCRAMRNALGAALLALWAPLVGAQSADKIYRVGYIQTASPQEQAPLTRAFEQGLRELGYVQGRNIVLESRFAWGNQERLPELAADLVRQNVDVIVTGANPVIAAVKQATTTIPVVMSTSRDPVGSGFVRSLARPGGNITGLTSDPSPEVQSKRLELLKEAMPRVTRVALLWNPLPPGAETYRAVMERAAHSLGLQLHAVPVRGRDDFERAFAAMIAERAQALVVLPDPIFFTARAQVASLATKHGLPAVFHAREFVDLGGLMSYGSSLDYHFRRAAVYVDRILKGAKPADLPVEQATRLEFVLNLKTAKALGLSIPSGLRLRADELIE